MGRNISFDIKGLETSILDVVESQLQDSMKEVSQDIMKGYKSNDNLKALDEYIERKVQDVIKRMLGDSIDRAVKRLINSYMWYGR